MPPFASTAISRTIVQHEDDIVSSDVSSAGSSCSRKQAPYHVERHISSFLLIPSSWQHSSSSGKSDYQKKNLRERLGGSIDASIDFLAYNGVAKSR